MAYWQDVVVALAVTAAALYAAWALCPPRPRWLALGRLDARLARGRPDGAAGALRRYVVAPLLARAAQARGCSGCDVAGANPALRRRQP
jgi:hypothetical protein